MHRRKRDKVTVRSMMGVLLLSVPVAVAVGSLVALFLWMLDLVTATRWQHPWLLFFLPLAGIAIVYAYRHFGKGSDAGHTLIIDEVHRPGGGVPARMTPMVLIATWITHLFGGSAGREGTAVQMGGSTAALFARWFHLHHAQKRILLMAGMSAGFGAVFGTPVAGAVFAIEVLASGRIRYEALLACLVAAIIGDLACTFYGITHTQYAIAFHEATIAAHWFERISMDPLLLSKSVIAATLFGCTGWAFAWLLRTTRSFLKRYLKHYLLLPAAGGVLIIVLCYAIGSFDYLGLGVTHPNNGPSIVGAFHEGGVTQWSWLWKLVFTVITLAAGFKGGEVTPLFFIGAALGNVLALLFHAPVDLFAALGFIAVFAAATNTPIASTLMGIELFGGTYVVYFAVACFVAYYFSGPAGIYGAQRAVLPKAPFHKNLPFPPIN